MDRLEELIKELPREIQQKAIDILEFFLQEGNRRAKSAALPEPRIPSSTPPIPSAPLERPLAPWQIEVALDRAELLRLYRQEVGSLPRGQRTRAQQDFIRNYKLGLSFPELLGKLGKKVSYATLQRWAQIMPETATADPLALAPHHGEHRRGRTKITAGQKRCLQEAAFHHNTWPLVKVVRAARKMMAKQGVEDSCTEGTYKRFLKKWFAVSGLLKGKSSLPPRSWIRQAPDHGKILYNRDGERP